MSTIHVVPLEDPIEHVVPGGIPTSAIAAVKPGDAWLCIEQGAGDEESCVCMPDVEHVPAEDGGPDGWLIIHHSLDGRELSE